ncbi:MAG TPA: ribosome small subunit-dependent GTPase A [Mycobacteriales bacterium]|nr:ribosome small subunit-dependent GTPase A [Mycobacteriales bacterium]
MTRRELDEDDVRVRPPRRGSRPRTKERPSHSGAETGVVVAVDRGRYTCRLLTPDGPADLGGPQITAMRARELGRKSVVVGDEVGLVGDLSGAPGTLARIVRILPRRTVLRRTADDTDPYERVIVANADQLVVVTALADPPPRVGLIDRCIVAAYVGGLDPVLCLTKADLVGDAGATDLLRLYSDLGVPAVTSRRDADPVDLRHRLAGRVSVLVGHSGVGKSTLVNRLVPEAERATGAVGATGRGRHTSSSAVALRLARGGWVIDTPGIRSFGLAHVHPADLLAALPDLAEGAEGCPPGCDHTGDASGGAAPCALDGWVRAGHATGTRLASYRRLLASRSAPDR